MPVGVASLYACDVGRGRPLIVLHGGPDFDHSYLRPELDDRKFFTDGVHLNARGHEIVGERIFSRVRSLLKVQSPVSPDLSAGRVRNP